MIDTYGLKYTAARCVLCGAFMPWSRSRFVEVDTAVPAAAPALVEKGVCVKCQTEGSE